MECHTKSAIYLHLIYLETRDTIRSASYTNSTPHTNIVRSVILSSEYTVNTNVKYLFSEVVSSVVSLYNVTLQASKIKIRIERHCIKYTVTVTYNCE